MKNILLKITAQWIQTNGPYGSKVQCLYVSPNGHGSADIFAGTNNAGVFLSGNNGLNRTKVSSGLTNPCINAICCSLASKKRNKALCCNDFRIIFDY